jgi:DNA-3-methyladenine glycosylase
VTVLPRTFYARTAVEAAPDLLGRILVRQLSDGQLLRARIVEVEAYEQDDPASHSFSGPTPRNRAMFGPAGHLYVYLSYGVHHCMNVVTGRSGVGSAVLLRAGEPLEGIEAMSRLRGRGAIRDLCRGPGRWASSFGVDRALDGCDLVSGGQIWITPGRPLARDAIASGPRVGISRAVDHAWRFVERGSPWASPGPV